MSSANRVMRLIGAIAAEKARKARTPRRGVASYFPDTGRLSQTVEEGSPGEIGQGYIFPAINLPITGRPVTPIAGEMTKFWVTDDNTTAGSFGSPQARRQPDNTIPNDDFYLG